MRTWEWIFARDEFLIVYQKCLFQHFFFGSSVLEHLADHKDLKMLPNFWINGQAFISLCQNFKEASPSAPKNTGVVLVPCLHMEVRHYSYFRWCGYFWGPWVPFVLTDEFSVRVKNYLKKWCLMNSQSTFLFFNLFKLMNYDYIIKSM